MKFIEEKINVIVKELEKTIELSNTPIDCEYIMCDYKTSNTPPSADAGWKPLSPKMDFDELDEHFWMHFTIPPIPYVEGAEPRLSVKTGKEGLNDSRNPQGLVYLNGVTTQALDTNHSWLPIEFDKEYDVYIYYYTGTEPGTTRMSTSISLVDLRIEGLYYDLQVPANALKCLDKGSNDYITICNCLDRATMLLDLRDKHSDAFYESIAKASEFMKNEFYGKVCGNSVGEMTCVGHTHIDVAWLWTVSQTKEKAQRSFSTALNLMDRYDDYVFMSSQPQLYQYVKENDPELYARIKERVKEGRWEVEGAMWLEADTNLISGESLIRQILYGKRFMKEEFDVDSEILWLPDVFGYSAALPQILKKSGVDKFFTTKIAWNETNSFPHDVFIWKGLDGSEVFSAFQSSYVVDVRPEEMKRFWESGKDRKLTKKAIMPMGFGDGGGGTTCKMIENCRRMEYGIPGIPKVTMGTAGEFFKEIKADFDESTKHLKYIPKWSGELYLETHRGTYTTIGKNKRNNRKSEFAVMEAETLSAWDMIINNGDYPREELQKIQTNILLNQFHDIIPGSSINQVYEDTDKEYAYILSTLRNISDSKMTAVKDMIKSDGGIFVYNPTPFTVSDVVKVGDTRYYAEAIPAHGWSVIESKPVDSGVTVTEKSIENDVIKVQFNDKYEIVSVYDKECDREVIAQGMTANRLESFEDYPRDYDAWEITEYYTQKMWVIDNVSDVTLLDDGIKIKRKYSKSEICQTIKLRRGSKRVDFETTVDWHEDHILLKAAFPLDIHTQNATYDIQFGNIERPTHKNTSWDESKFEVSAHKWADMSEGNYGVSILNDCKYGYSADENVMKISLLKSPKWPNPQADMGMHIFTYSLYPHKGDIKASDTIKEAYMLNLPLEVSTIEKHDGIMPQRHSMIESDCDGVIVESVKKSEVGEDIIVRLFETYNSKECVTIKTGFEFKEVYLCDMLENNIEKLDNDGNKVKLNVKNFEIITLKFIL